MKKKEKAKRGTEEMVGCEGKTSELAKNEDSSSIKSTQEQAPAGDPLKGLDQQAVDTSSAEKLAQLEQQVVEFRDRYLRSVAEMDNMRKRLERERIDYVKYSLEGILKDLLEVADCFESALNAQGNIPAGGAVKCGAEKKVDDKFFEGISMIKRRFLDILVKYGIEPIKATGEKFDPNIHQAIQRVESDQVKDEMVDEEFSKGYLLNGRLLRPAIVKVILPKNVEQT